MATSKSINWFKKSGFHNNFFAITHESDFNLNLGSNKVTKQNKTSTQTYGGADIAPISVKSNFLIVFNILMASIYLFSISVKI